ncbi:hypothetical protein U0070_008014 [Myodes glareolus]|uniref:Uncharacterized protein n=1 Tax=Myodes glareolus TaxID=447135 RepID=A0AAW0HDI0_MYOGA
MCPGLFSRSLDPGHHIVLGPEDTTGAAEDVAFLKDTLDDIELNSGLDRQREPPRFHSLGVEFVLERGRGKCLLLNQRLLEEERTWSLLLQLPPCYHAAFLNRQDEASHWTHFLLPGPGSQSWFSFLGEVYQGTKDMFQAHTDMKEANWIGADKYFHARGNYDAARRGPGGVWAAEVLRRKKYFFRKRQARTSGESCCEAQSTCPPVLSTTEVSTLSSKHSVVNSDRSFSRLFDMVYGEYTRKMSPKGSLRLLTDSQAVGFPKGHNAHKSKLESRIHKRKEEDEEEEET